jgi:uncharacterized protein involved in propanediol utilization
MARSSASRDAKKVAARKLAAAVRAQDLETLGKEVAAGSAIAAADRLAPDACPDRCRFHG